jgi:ferric-dicitrate binding protein FerR (iron transport regulator)
MTASRIPSHRTSARAVRLLLGPLALGLLLAAPAASQPQAPPGQPEQPAAEPAGTDGSYGYLRLVEGSASLTQASSGTTSAAEVNQPILPGDRLAVPQRGHVEVVLADHNIVRLDGETQVEFTHLANSAGQQDPSTEIRLDEGNLQLMVTDNSVGQELPTVLTPNASVYIQAYGSYRITSDRGDYSAVVVRRGTAEVVNTDGDSTVHAGEEAVADNQRRAGIDVHQAGGFDALERWGRQLDDETRVAQSSYVDPSLGYESAPLDRYGHWINVDDRQYWQPNDVDSGWSPYWQGSWDSTPEGATWVSSEPWGWVPYHYGSWDYLPAYGWAWQPGYVFSPAWVYWYWGPSYVGWCPIGFYTGFYGNAFASFRFGAFGWAGGDWGAFRFWNFCPIGHFFGRDFRRFGFRGDGDRDFDDGFGRRRGFSSRGFPSRGFPTGTLPRGLITTSTRGITPAVLRTNPRNAMNVLARQPSIGRAVGTLPDVTPFIRRQTNLSPAVAHAVATTGGTPGRLAGTPLAPHTLGTRPGTIARGNLPGAGSRTGVDRFNGGGASGGARGFSGPRPAMPGTARGVQPLNPRVQQGQPDRRGIQPQQHLGTFGSGRVPQGGNAQRLPTQPSPATPRAWTPNNRGGGTGGGAGGWSPGLSPRSSQPSTGESRPAPARPLGQNGSPYSSSPRYQVTPRTQAPGYQGTPRSQVTPRYQSPYQSPRSYGSSPGYQSPRSYGSSPGYQGAPRYQTAPRYQQPSNRSTPGYQSAPSYRSAPQYQSAPRYQAPPRYQVSPPRYQSAPRYQSSPRYQSAPHTQAPRSSAPSRGRSSGGGSGSGSRGSSSGSSSDHRRSHG